jgi:hypothetical protein
VDLVYVGLRALVTSIDRVEHDLGSPVSSQPAATPDER